MLSANPMSMSNDMEAAGSRRGHSTREKEAKRSRVRPTEDDDEPKQKEESHAPPSGWWKTFNWKEGRAFEVFSQDDWWQANVRRNEMSKVTILSTLYFEKQSVKSRQVLVRYVGGTAEDDEWIPIDRYGSKEVASYWIVGRVNL